MKLTKVRVEPQNTYTLNNFVGLERDRRSLSNQINVQQQTLEINSKIHLNRIKQASHRSGGFLYKF